MAGPWEKYGAQTGQPAGPWQKYASPQPAVPESQTVPDMLSGMNGAAARDQEASQNAGMSAPVYVGQQANRGLADTIGAPVDLATGALNAGLAGVDTVAEMFGGNVDTRIRNPVMGSDWIANLTSQLYEGAGGTVVDKEQVSPAVRMLGAGARGGAAALLPGMALASGPAQIAAQGKNVPGVFKSLTAPYSGASGGAVLARDAVAGAGAGTGAQMYDELAPESVQESSWSPILKAAAAMIGGVGATGVESVAEGTLKGGARAARNLFRGSADPNAPINPATGQGYSRGEMDMAARVAQMSPTNKAQAVANIDENVADFEQYASPSQMPTTGMLADDIGMAVDEQILRSRDAKPFIERDARRRDLAAKRIDESVPRGANSRDFTREASEQYRNIEKTAEQGVDDAVAKQATAQADLQRQNVELEGYRARQPEVSSAMAEDFSNARQAARSVKNSLYDAADPATPVDGRFLNEALDRIDGGMSEMERMSGGAYAEIANRVRQRLAGDAPVTYGDIKTLRAQISEARKNAVAASGQSVAGSGSDVQRLDQLGQVVGKLADDINPEASRFYREQYAPRFKEGRAGEYGAQIDRATRTGGESSATRPSEFGSKFLRAPEDAASFKRAMSEVATDPNALPGPDTQTGPSLDPRTSQNVREWMMGDLAKSGVLTDNAEIRYDRFKKWADANRQTINQFPDLAKTVDDELSRAQRGGMMSKTLAREIEGARANLNLTKKQLNQSALQAAIGNSPENAVANIMSSGDPERRMGEMVGRLKGNKEATDGLKAAVRDWIKDKAGTTQTTPGSDDAARYSAASLEKVFRKHEKTLAGIYSPDEMNALRQAHKLLRMDAKLNVRATSGSNTFDKAFADEALRKKQLNRMLEGGLKGYFGVLKGGGVFRTINLFLDALPDGKQGLENILFEMHFNPDLAKHLLTRKVTDVGTPAWNSKLNKLLAAATGGRESGEQNPD